MEQPRASEFSSLSSASETPTLSSRIPPRSSALGKISDPQVILALLACMLIAILMGERIGSAILIGIIAITIAGIPLGLSHWPAHLFSLPHPSGTLFKLDLRCRDEDRARRTYFRVFLCRSLRQRWNTRRSVRRRRVPAGWQIAARKPRVLADAFGTIIGALTGTSTVTSYIESAAGVAAGARTGLGNLVIAGLFVGAMFCAPLVAAIPSYATAPALILVGALMCAAVARVKWDDFTDAVPAFLTLIATPLTFSIATGLSLGLLSFTFLKLFTGRYREISALIWVLSALFLARYIFLGAG